MRATINCFLLLLTLSTLSLAKEKVVILRSIKEVPKHNPDIIAWPKFTKANKTGAIDIDLGCTLDLDQDYIDMRNVKLRDKNIHEKTSKCVFLYLNAPYIFYHYFTSRYQSIKDDQITGLRIGNNFSLTEFKKCESAESSLDIARLISYTAYFLNEIEFVPSLSYAIKDSPTKLIQGTTEDMDQVISVDGITYKFQSDLFSNCHAADHLEYSIWKTGIYNESCIPNNFTGIPGYNIPRDLLFTKNAAPEPPKKCAKDGKFKNYYKGYRFGRISKGNSTTLKRAITRYGPVLLTEGQYKIQTGPNTYAYYGDLSGLVVGWDQLNWIYITPRETRTFDMAFVSNEKESIKLKWSTAVFASDDIEFSGIVFGNNVSIVRTAWSIATMVVVIPAFLLFF